MIKMRLQGSRNEIRWFLKVLEKDPRFDVEDTSEMFSIKTSNRYKRLYTNIYRKQTSTVYGGKQYKIRKVIHLLHGLFISVVTRECPPTGGANHVGIYCGKLKNVTKVWLH